MDEQVLNLFGITLEQLLLVSAVVLFAVESAKKLFPTYIDGAKTIALSAVFSFAVAWKVAYPNWEHVIALAVLTVLASAGTKSLIKKAGTGNTASG